MQNIIIKYNLQELPPAILHKSLKAKQAFLAGYTSAINRGLTDDEAYFSGLSQATTAERLEKAARTSSEPIKPKLPQHLAVLLEKRSEAAVEAPVSTPRIRQEFLGKNALAPDADRSLVSATWDKNGRLQLQFDDGQKIVTDPVPVSENIEQYISVTAGTSDGGTAVLPDEYDYLRFNTAAGVQPQTAQLSWNDTDGTLDLGLKGGNVTLQIGQEQVTHVYNNTAADFTDMQVVRITGSQGQRLTAGLAQADTAASASTFAIVTEAIPKNSTGFATASGLVRNVDTSAFPEGAVLYLSATTAGAITAVKPAAPMHVVMLGWCVRSNTNNGSIYVHVQNGQELGELHDVNVVNPQQDQVLAYDSVSGTWVNRTITDESAEITLTKAPNEVANMVVNFSNRLANGEHIQSVSSVVSTPNGLTISNISNTNTSVTFNAAGGTLLQGYRIDITASTQQGNSLTASVYLLNI